MGNFLYQVMSNKNIERALKALENGSNRPGLDGMHPSELRAYWKMNGPALRERVGRGKYHPQPVESFEILSRSGKRRQLAHYCAVDRLVQR
ncbi:MAG: hypothetical protein IKZ87_06845, partial [Actinomycetaceae bacterium]|nr:hypothetical protein [Actinomycetaceae bacterium]